MALPLALTVLPWGRMIGYAVLAASLFGAGAYWMHGRQQAKYEKLVAEYATFKGGVGALGNAAKIANEKRKLLDIKAKEYADEKAVRDLAAARSRIARMRADADRARGSGLPATPANSRCPEGLVCYEERAFERQRARHRDGVRQLLDEGTEVELKLEAAIEWANGRTP